MNLLIEFLNNLFRTAIVGFGITDLILTWDYLSRYKKLCPNKSFNKMERNPLIVFLINLFGLNVGMIIGIIVIMTLIIIISFDANIIIVLILLLIQIYALVNHKKNFKILKKLKGGVKNG